MKTLALLTLLGVLSTPAIAQAEEFPLPKADTNGDYIGKISHSTWVVVDLDPKGLNCRWSNRMPADWQSPSAVWPAITPESWSVAQRFRGGSILEANGGVAGFSVMADDRELPWLKVLIGTNDKTCLVRANKRFIRPIPTE